METKYLDYLNKKLKAVQFKWANLYFMNFNFKKIVR